MKKSILLILLAFTSIGLSAQEPVLVGGLWYTISSYDGTAMVVANPYNQGYSGDIVIPDKITINGEEHVVTQIGQRAFCGTKILSVKVSGSVKYINNHAFSYSTVATAIIGEESETSLYVQNYAFYACENLTTIVFGDNVISIGNQTFQNCPSLTSVVLGKKMRGIGTSSFVDCENLKDIYCMSEYSPYQSWGRIFENDKPSSLTLHVPEAYASNYTSYPWSDFGNKVTIASPELVKCATPIISYSSGTVSFTCTTEGVKYNSTVEYVENEFNNVNDYPAPSHFKVKVVAVKDGFLPSDVAEQEFALESYVDVATGDYKPGDVNKDGNVNVADHVKLSSFIMK